MVSRIAIKDGSLLLLAGLILSVVAWAFWRYLGENAFAVLMMITLAALWVDNRRLRRQLSDKLSSRTEQR